MNKIVHTASYFNPFAKNPCSDREALVEFKELSPKSKAKIVALTILAFLGTLFILGTGAVATFRIWTNKFSKIKANEYPDPIITKTENTFEAVIKNSESTPERIKNSERTPVRIKNPERTPEKVGRKPIGFKNYGNSCWFGSGLQCLLASEHFELIVREKLERRSEIFEQVQNKKELIARSETDKEFTQRLKVQSLLIRIIELRKEGKEKETNNAVKALHQLTSEIKSWIAPIGNGSSFTDVIDLIECLFPGHIKHEFNPASVLSSSGINIDNEDYIEHYKKRLFGNFIPKMICTRILPRDLFSEENSIIGPDYKFSFSKDGKSYAYRIVALVEELPNHFISYVRNQEEWYCCNDSSVSKVSKESLKIVGASIIILELC